jgi:hypothetical protein
MSAHSAAPAAQGFRLEHHLLGETRVWGLVHDRFGRLRREFSGSMHGETRDRTLILREELRFPDGGSERRVWRLLAKGESDYRGQVEGAARDVIGRAAGFSVNLRYRLPIRIAGRDWPVDFDDWMFLQPDGTVLDRAEMRLFGFRLGTVTALFSRNDRQDLASAAASAA